ncbi:Carboxylesterase family [Popillia japonica]|uniref:Carboxylic ester hydrolase n=1 Tax=Popillia japonica TaxID=7064 RepID=A0AAW1IDP9_POPJA
MFYSKDILIICQLLLTLTFYDIKKVQAGTLEIEVEHGWVRGRQMSNSLFAWSGIPYAKPPLGDLRFEPPQALNNWTGIWDATYDRSQCVAVSTDHLLDSVIYPQGNEDCLYINVYTPRVPDTSNSLLPVMVWIYGGTFIGGNSSYALYGPDQLVSKEVIVVSFNYRLGIFGFLSTGDTVAPGNTGLKDQIFALKWIQKNIKAFGGNPNQVTIFGESAGAASVSYLVLSPRTKGLFHRAIMESGSALCLWALSKTCRQAANMTGYNLGIIADTSKELVRQLKNVAMADLQRASIAVMLTFFGIDPLNGLIFAPVIEPLHDDAVITGASYEKLRLGNFNQVPQIIGYNSVEAVAAEGLVKVLSFFLVPDILPKRLVPASMNANTIDLRPIGTRIKNFYTGGVGGMAFPSSNFVNYVSDNEFVRPIQATVNLTAQHADVYFYKFAYTRNSSAVGAGHGAELPFIFNSNFTTSDDNFIRSCITKLWASFATTGNPTSSGACNGVEWQTVAAADSTLPYLNIDRNVTLEENPDASSMRFWINLFEEYSHPVLMTY